MRESRRRLKSLRFPLMAAAFVFVVMFVTMCITAAGMFFLVSAHLLKVPPEGMPFLIFGSSSLVVGTFLAVLFSHRPLAPLREFERAIERIADGDFSVRVQLKGESELAALGDKFNHMAEELGSVELLRSDFVNNFSHEFKTPIVSIRGFARALKWDDLSEAERQEYLNIIISESERLSDLSTNVLYLSKLEQQSILTDRRRFNVSEQIRLAVALLDSKWASRRVEFDLDADEVFFTGSADLLKQVWINLLDNAIKFSPEGGTVGVYVRESADALTVGIRNDGVPISDECAAHLFDKFYQGDRSHTTQGSGLGLTIARRIVALHGGTIRLLRPTDGGNLFEASLPTHEEA